jgi:two-component system, chemotaxis family, response regulator Rcp1
MSNPFTILLVEDNPADVRLTEEALIGGKVTHNLHVATNGIEAMAFLHQEPPFSQAPRPDLVLLDWYLPEKDGREVLSEIKSDAQLARIPVIILSTSQDEKDILESYNLYANGYIVKPVDLDQFFHVIKQLKDFWFKIVVLPTNNAKFYPRE